MLKLLLGFVPRPMIEVHRPGLGKYTDRRVCEVDAEGDEIHCRVVWMSPRRFAQLPEFTGW